MIVFAHLNGPDQSLLFSKKDPNDTRLGEVVLTQPDDYKIADIVLLGLPQDEGVRRNGGRVGAENAPDAVRRQLYRLVSISNLKFFDAGNTIIQTTLEETHAVHQDILKQILLDGKNVVVLGGGNDTSYPDCSALSEIMSGDVLGFNIDAHFDVRADAPRNSGTPYRQLLEENRLKYFYEIAYQPFANSSTYVKYLAQKKVATYSLTQVHEEGLSNLLNQLLEANAAQSVFWGLDMDAVRAADAPGVSAVNPTGLTGEEFASIGSTAGSDPRTRVFEITEVNPTYDIDDLTCRLAAVAIWKFLNAYQMNNKESDRNVSTTT